MDYNDNSYGDPFPAPPGRKARRRGCLAPLCVAASLALAVGFLPRVLSTAPARARVLQRVNEKIAPAELEAAWRLRWWGRQEVTDVRYTDYARGLDFSCGRVETPGLLRLLLTRPNAGGVDLARPVLLFDDAETLAAFLRAQAARPPALPDAGTQAKNSLLSKLKNTRLDRCGVSGGFAGLKAPSSCGISVAHGAISGGLHHWVTMDAEGGVGEAGRYTMNVAVPPPSSWAQSPLDCALQARGGLELENADARLVNAALEMLGAPWSLEGGRVTGKMEIGPSPGHEGRRKASADVRAEDVSLALPRAENPRAALIALDAEMEVSREGAEVGKFTFASPWVNAEVQGGMWKGRNAAAPRGKISGTLEVFAAEAWRDFAGVLDLPQEPRITRGAVLAEFSSEGGETAMTHALKVTAQNVELSRGDHAVAVSPPPLLDMEVALPYTSPPVLSRLDARLPFASVRGRGALDAAEVSGGVDFDLFAEKYGALFAGAPRLAGGLKFYANTSREGDVAHLAATGNTVGFTAAFDAREPLTLGNAAMSFSGQVPLSAELRPMPELRQAKWELEAPALGVKGSCAAFSMGEGFAARALELAVKGDLPALSKLAAPWLPQLQAWQPRGAATLSVTAEAADGVARARFVSVLRDASLATRRFDIREPAARFDGGVAWVAADKTLTLTNAQFTSTAATVTAEALKIQYDASRKAPLVDGAISAEANLAEVASWARRDPAMPAKQAQGKLKARAAFAADEWSLNAELANTVIPLHEPLLIKEGAFLARGSLSPDADTFEIRQADLRLPFLEADFQGRLYDFSVGVSARLYGRITPDLEKLAPFVPAALAEAGFRMSGNENWLFTFDHCLADGFDAFRLRGETKVSGRVGSLSMLGVTASEERAKLALHDGLLEISYAPKTGGGKLNFTPEILVASDPPALTLKSSEPILEDVPLTRELADALLVYVNPALKGAAGMSGRLTLSLGAENIPLDETWRTGSFDGRVQMKDVNITPDGMLGEILSALNLPASTRVTLADYASDITCKDGRVSAAPMTLMIGDMPARFEGSTMLGGAVDCMVTLTLTEKVVGATAWPHVGGAKLTVPVTGTVRKPSVDAQGLAAKFNALAKEAEEQKSAEQARDILERIREGLREE